VKFYIATGFRNVDAHHRVRDVLVKDGHEITYDWTLAGETNDPLVYSNISECEIQGVKDADFLVVLLPGKFGTHAELGAALALDKPVILCGYMEYDCIFYHHPNVEKYGSFEEWYKGSVFNSKWPCGKGMLASNGPRPVGL